MGQKINSSVFRAGVNHLWKLDSNINDQARSNNFSIYSYFFIKKKIKQYKSKIVHFKSEYGPFISFYITIYKFLKKKQKKLKWWQRKKLFEKKLNQSLKKKTALKSKQKISLKNRITSKLNLKKRLKKNYFILKLLLKKKKINTRILSLLNVRKINGSYNFFNSTKSKNVYRSKKTRSRFYSFLNTCNSFGIKKKSSLKFKSYLFNKDKIVKQRIVKGLSFCKHSKVKLQFKRKSTKYQIKNLLKFIKVKIKLQKELELFFKKSVTLKLQNVFWKLPVQCLIKIKDIKDKLNKFRTFRGLKDLVNIITISSYFFTPELFSDFIAREIEASKKQKFLIKILSFSLKNAFPVLKILKGVKFIIWGKVEKSQRTRKFISKWGRVNTTNLCFQTDESLSHCFTKYGVFGVRVIFTKEWSIKKDVNLKHFKKKI